MTGPGLAEPLLGGGLLYCGARFHELNDVPVDRRWRHEHRRPGGPLVGVLDGVLTDGALVSGHSAPFGGLDLVRDDPAVTDLVDLVSSALASLRAQGVGRVEVRARPVAYSAAEPLVEYVLLNCGFTVERCDLNMHVDLAGVVDPLLLLKERKRRYVRAALRGSWELVEVTGGEDLTTLHRILADNRTSHGRPLPLARDYLARVSEAFPDRVQMRLLRLDGRPVAGAVVYRALEDVHQVVHWADAPDGDLAHSPMELLAYLVYREALESGARLVDLGPASEKDGRPNIGLVAFKRSVGASPGTRKVFTAALD
ncbi:GNAT family N-acetyltransferase [Blastococcus sp. SYSU DS0552]